MTKPFEEKWKEINIGIAKVVLTAHAMTSEINEFTSRSLDFEQKQKEAGDAIDELRLSISSLLQEQREQIGKELVERLERETKETYATNKDHIYDTEEVGFNAACTRAQEIINEMINKK